VVPSAEKVPGWHCKHSGEPSSAYLPIGQAEQVSAPEALNLPAVHALHSAEPLTLIVPASQNWHSAAPSALNLPAGQTAQPEEPLLAANVPAMQVLQLSDESLSLYCPGLHWEHNVAPVLVKVPARQVEQW
jgi:hypothetical protein